MAAIGTQLLWYGTWEKQEMRTRFLRGLLHLFSAGTGRPAVAGIMFITMALAGVVTALLGDAFYVAWRNMFAPPVIALLLRDLPLLLFGHLFDNDRIR